MAINTLFSSQGLFQGINDMIKKEYYDTNFTADIKKRIICGYNLTPLNLYFSKQWLIKNTTNISLKILQLLQKVLYFPFFNNRKLKDIIKDSYTYNIKKIL